MAPAVALCSLKRLSLMIGTLVVTLAFASPASAAPDEEALGGIGYVGSTVEFWGEAIFLKPSWTYSFRLRQGPRGSWPRELAWGGRNGLSDFQTPTYRYQRYSGTNCVELRIYHSATVGNNLVDVAEACL
jgi:hypothetical protein